MSTLSDRQQDKATHACDMTSGITLVDPVQFGGLARAMRGLSRTCGGKLPDHIEGPWRTVQEEMQIVGDTGCAIPGELAEALNALTVAMRFAFRASVVNRATPQIAQAAAGSPLAVFTETDDTPVSQPESETDDTPVAETMIEDDHDDEDEPSNGDTH